MSEFGSGGPLPGASRSDPSRSRSRLASWDRPRAESQEAERYLPGVGIVLAWAGGALSAVMLTASLVLAVVRRPFEAVDGLLTAGFSVLFALWAVAIVLQARTKRSWGEVWPFSLLSARQRTAVLLVVGAAVLLGLNAAPYLRDGQPVDPTSTCAYPLSEHGRITCATEPVYLHTGAAGQQLFTAALAGFAAIATAAGLSQRGRG